MRQLFSILLLSGVGVIYANAQSLFTYGTKSVSKDEFLRVYKKNSITKTADLSDTALKSYLDLYSLFKMKVAEAENEHLDTLQKVQSELDNYRKQLAKNYLTDSAIINKMIHESYNRMKEDIHVAHILVSCSTGSDTVNAYKKIDSIYHLLADNKASFDDMAKKCSDDKGSKDNGGDVGYFTSLQTVYQFENTAFTTPVGKISKPFRTQFGYHIIKVIDKRADKGSVKVAQILISTPKSKGDEYVAKARVRADSVIKLINMGVPFAELVRRYSDDKYSVNDSGILKPFGTGKMVMPFEVAAFALKKPGDVVTEPVKTEYGFHIIKLIAKYPLPPFDSLYPQIKHKVENDARAQNAKDVFYNKVKEQNGYKEYPENINSVVEKMTASIPDTGKAKGTFKATNLNNMTKPVFTLAGKTYTQNDFAQSFERLTRGRVNGQKGIAIHDAFKLYVNNVVTDFEEHHLVEVNPEFKNLMTEYKDGIMLFELMDRNVWGKASHDSAGLKSFYETRKGKYMWDAGFEGSIYIFKNKAALDTGMIVMKDAQMTDEQMVKILNNQTNPDRVSIQHGHYEFAKYKEVTLSELNANKTKVINLPNGTYKVIVAKTINTSPVSKTLDEARGYVVAEYQDYLEKQWNEKMHHDYPLKVNDKVFKSIVKK